MGLYLNPKATGFQRAIQSEIYVDKTDLIAFTNKKLDTEQMYICVSRPRRFGKSITAKMLAAYYCRSYDSRALFQNYKIAKEDCFETHLNQYHVLFLNMQDFLSRAEHAESLSDYLQEKVLKELQETYNDLIDPLEKDLVEALLKIYAATGEGFVFIIDEWDCIFREKKNAQTIQMKYLDFLRSLLKDQPYVKLAYMTGILPIKKYGTHSALNMFTEYSMTEPKRLAGYIGFTEAEVKALCNRYKMDFEETRRWYDGYQFSDELHIYNPKSVVDAMLNQEFNSYWTKTETYEALKVYIDMNFDGLRDAVVLMMGGESCAINPGTFHNDMTTFNSKDDVLTLLVHLGYLSYNREKKEVAIPNEEIRGEFYNAISISNWDGVMRAICASKELLEHTWNMDQEAVAKGLDAAHQEVTSILTYNNENALSCVISLAYYSARDEYTFIRELPMGKGFADLVFLPHKYSDRPAMLVELKWDESASGAIQQIKEKHYVQALEHYTGNLLLVGINYDKNSKKHQCVIEPYQNGSVQV